MWYTPAAAPLPAGAGEEARGPLDSGSPPLSQPPPIPSGVRGPGSLTTSFHSSPKLNSRAAWTPIGGWGCDTRSRAATRRTPLGGPEARRRPLGLISPLCLPPSRVRQAPAPGSMYDPNDDTDVTSGTTDGAQMERASPPVRLYTGHRAGGCVRQWPRRLSRRTMVLVSLRNLLVASAPMGH